MGDERRLSATGAFDSLDKGARAGVLTEAQSELYKGKYSQVHHAVLTSYHREKDFLAQAKEAKDALNDAEIEMMKAEKAREDLHDEVSKLEVEREQATKESRDAEEREKVLVFETNELKRRESERGDELKLIKKANADLVQPELRRLTEEIAETREQLAQADAAMSTSKEQREAGIERLEKMAEIREKTEEAQASARVALSKIRNNPERINKQAASVKKACEKLILDVDKLKARIYECDGALLQQTARQKESEERKAAMDKKLQSHREDIEARMHDVDTVEMSLKLERERQKKFQERRAANAALKEEMKDKVKSATALLARKQKAYEKAKKDLKKKQMAHEALKLTLPLAKNQLVDSGHTLAAHIAECKRFEGQAADLKQEGDIFVFNFLKQEGVEKKKRQLLEELLAIEAELEKEREEWRAEEAIASKQISTLTAQRELKSRDLTKAQANAKATLEELKIKELLLADLTKKAAETNHQLKEFSKLYDVVKNERNSYVNAIQTASQALAEMKERIKILHNEVDILNNESAAKDKALTEERLAHSAAQVHRDTKRLEANKHHATYTQAQEQVEQQIVEIEKLNNIINTMEKEMLALKSKYEEIVEMRNYTGIQLIDRNDELCILYEKANIHDETLRKGEVEIREQEQKVRMLRITVAELEREIQVTRKIMPQMPKHAEKILQLQKELKSERELTEKLCEDLETPANADRWRALEGEDPDADELAEKITVLEERLNAKKEQLLEKELVLEEVTALSERLRGQAASGRASTLAQAKSVNTYQARIKELNRRMMAVVSELSMYSATALKLEKEQQEREGAVREGSDRLERGEPPSTEAEHAWYRYERDRMRRMEGTMRASAAAAAPPTVTRTTAEPRPNAYIPEDIPIPKPYGALAPFKPSVPGSTMRHVRKPVPKEVEI